MSEQNNTSEATETVASSERYNGWANYPTWAVNLWLSNDEGLYLWAREKVQDILSESESRSEYWTLAESHRFAVADMLKDWCDELATGEGTPLGDAEPSFVTDLIGYALGEVDWHEIADAWIEGEAE